MRQVIRVGTRTLLTLAMALAVATISTWARTAQAHHSFAMFDQAQQVTLKGTVHEFQWTNPHAWIHLDVPGANGINDSWQVELNSPNNLKRQGWKSTSVKAGDQVTLVLNPLKDGSKGGLFVSITLPDGSVLGDPTRAHGGPINVPSAH
ncbi:MAG TPA: DUF6152 family protein [Steroidobacteraceae bacterium]|jgi:hypothetical protein|nr:DUF6152 family protein [Steroidobacteraceae bacterium]